MRPGDPINYLVKGAARRPVPLTSQVIGPLIALYYDALHEHTLGRAQSKLLHPCLRHSDPRRRAAARLARAPAAEPARAGRSCGHLRAPCELPGDWPLGPEPGHVASTGGTTRCPATRA